VPHRSRWRSCPPNRSPIALPWWPPGHGAARPSPFRPPSAWGAVPPARSNRTC
jgi:hypothetical protein